MDEYMLMLEVGNGITVLSEHNMLKLSPRLKFIRIPHVNNVKLVACWLAGSTKPAAELFIGVIESLIAKQA